MNSFKTNQSGRSMVEMLGVLAIMGILSVGGIAMYKTAVNRYYANEILNEVNKRAVVASGQLLTRETINLEEFTKKVQGYEISEAENNDWTPMQHEFAIKVVGIPEEICKKILQTGLPLATDTYINKTSKSCNKKTNTIAFSFNNDLSVGNPVSRQLICHTENKPEKATNQCVNGLWQCPSGQLECNGVCCNETELCISQGSTEKGTCYTPESNGERNCATNVECTEEGTFCFISGNSTTQQFGCPVATIGKCTQISSYYTNGSAAESVAASGAFKGWTYSKSRMNWWAANNWCLAQGKFLVSLDDVNNAVQRYTGTEVTNASRSTAFTTTFDASGFWTNTIYPNNSCYVYSLLKSGSLSGSNRNSVGNDKRAMCRG